MIAMAPRMHWYARLHFLHRAWRYRLRSERFGISFLRHCELTGKAAVDIGAHWGIYSYWMHDLVGPRGRVIGFEPQPELFEHLKELRAAFRLDCMELAKMGLSTEEGELLLRRPKSHWGGANLGPEADIGCECDIIPTKVTTLDHYFANHSARPIRFIKCDVEGHEYQVFRGGEQILKTDRPLLLFECHDAANPNCQVFAYLHSLNYEGFCFYGAGFAPVSQYRELRPKLHKKAIMDFVFVPCEEASKVQSASSTTKFRL